jgi:hypothetical protein
MGKIDTWKMYGKLEDQIRAGARNSLLVLIYTGNCGSETLQRFHEGA